MLRLRFLHNHRQPRPAPHLGLAGLRGGLDVSRFRCRSLRSTGATGDQLRRTLGQHSSTSQGVGDCAEPCHYGMVGLGFRRKWGLLSVPRGDPRSRQQNTTSVSGLLGIAETVRTTGRCGQVTIPDTTLTGHLLARGCCGQGGFGLGHNPRAPPNPLLKLPLSKPCSTGGLSYPPLASCVRVGVSHLR